MENKHKIHLPELLAPAGSFAHLEAAVKAGADAVYAGGSSFGARAYADNFHEEEMVRAIHYAHFHNVKLYMTVNTLMKEQEIAGRLISYLVPYYEAGLDGVIVQDLGAAALIRKHFPEMEVHGSTQMTITDIYGARAAKDIGMCRVVPARELSLQEIRTIKEDTGLDMEVFVHGALCYCYSGQCLFSSFYGARSGNRGRCAQPCRQYYELLRQPGNLSSRSYRQPEVPEGQGYLLSPRDMNSIHMLPELIKAGVDSLKIEGRMKSVDYVAGVTMIYRRYLDWCQANEEHLERYQVSSSDEYFLEELYSRGGFTEGYWHQNNGNAMMSLEYPKNMGRDIGTIQKISRNQITIRLNDAKLHARDVLVIPRKDGKETVLTVPETQEGKTAAVLNVPKSRLLHPGMKVYRRWNAWDAYQIAQEVLSKDLSRPVQAKIRMYEGEPVKITMCCGNTEITLWAESPEHSENRPVSEDMIRKQFEKTGNVPFVLKKMTVDLGKDCFYPASRLKKLRQQSYESLFQKMYEKERDFISQEVKDDAPSVSIRPDKLLPTITKNVMVYDKITMDFCAKQNDIHGIILDGDFFYPEDIPECAKRIHQAGKKVMFRMPRILRGERDTKVWKELVSLQNQGLIQDIYANTFGECRMLFEQGIVPVIGEFCYVWNRSTLSLMKNLYGKNLKIVLPLELSGEEQKEVWMREPEAKRELIVYGRVPMMVSAQCPKASLLQCDHKPEVLALKKAVSGSGQRSVNCLVSTHCSKGEAPCATQVWSHVPRNLIGEEMDGILIPGSSVRFDFFQTSEKEITEVLSEFRQWEQTGFRKRSSSADPYWIDGVE